MPVEWSEINAAWGMAALMLRAQASSMDFKFREWVPVSEASSVVE